MKNLLLFTLLFLFFNSQIIDFPTTTDNLPSILINTKNSSHITSKERYAKGTFKIYKQSKKVNFKIRGRGNSTWRDFQKKPYQIKFNKPESILGMSESKKWILLANYSDKTMLRNEIAFELSRFSNLDWTPESRFIDLYINREYVGVYQITQKVKKPFNPKKTNKKAYLLEIESSSRLDTNTIYFTSKIYNLNFNIKEPNVSLHDTSFVFIKNYINQLEKVLHGNDFTNSTEGYSKYIDVNSFIDWYLINEITKNNDAIFHTSVFMNYISGEKLKMGPIWDYDISLGNINYNGNERTDGFWVKKASWYNRLFQDPIFISKVKKRFNYFYKHKKKFYEKIYSNSKYLNKSQEKNFSKWPILGVKVWPNYVYYDTYNEEVEYLANWLDKRFEWLYYSINKL